MKQLIEDEIRKIADMEERVLFKKLINNLFLSLYEKNSEMYQELEQRVFDEVTDVSENYIIYGGLIEKGRLADISDIYSPMLEQDGEAVIFDKEAIKQALGQKQSIKVMQVFIECDYLHFREILDGDTNYHGYLKTKEGIHPCQFSLRVNCDYIERIKAMYDLFILNGIPWKTVNHPYAFRMVDVYLDSCESLEQEITEIDEIVVDFRRYKNFIRYDLVPVWNIKKKQVMSIGFPMPCENHKTYQHVVSLKGEQEQNGYLIGSGDVSIHQIVTKKKQLLITTDVEALQNWDFYVVHHCEPDGMNFFDYPVFSNVMERSFLARLHNENKMNIRTEAELIRFINAHDLGDYLVFERFEIVGRNDEARDELGETYSMNPFIVDEIRQPDAKNYLVLSMGVTGAESFLVRDVLSFLIAELQLIYPEYHCLGRIV